MKLDLGSGPTSVKGFEGVDRVPGSQHCFDLTTGVPWPWADNSIEALRCSHFIEHIPASDVWVTDPCPHGLRRRLEGEHGNEPGSDACLLCGHVAVGVSNGRWVDALIFFFDEAYRVIEPGGLFEVIWPALQSTQAFQDPTHRRFIPPEQLPYLNRDFRANNRLAFIGARCHWVVELCAGKPMRELPKEPAVLAHAVLTEWNAVSEYRALLRAEKR